MRVDIFLLGGFSVVVDGRPIESRAWTRRNASALVKVLALQPDRRLPRERLVDLLWPDLLLDRALPRLHKAAHHARSVLGSPSGVVLAGDAVTLFPDDEVVVDVALFEETASDPAVADRAIDLYRGDLLPGDPYEPWADVERERLRAQHLDLLRSAGRWSELVAADPLDEEAHLHVVRHHVQAGRRAQALRHLGTMDRVWRDELGIGPGVEATALRASVEAMPVIDPARLVPNRGVMPVPRPASRTIGRDDDVAAVRALLDTSRLVTVLGVGGVGKTRVAAEVAHEFAQATGQRTCYVDLTRINDPALVGDLVVRELGIRAGDEQNVLQVLEEALHRQSMLLVLDSFEHVVESADVVARMLQVAADVRVLVTSRARLRIAGEQVFELQPLAMAPAVALLDQVARSVDPDFDLAHHLDDVTEICHSTDGLPLAIEIAGGHLRTLSPALLRERLASRLASGSAAGRDRPDRQQTIPATIDWSLQLLGAPERRLFARLSVFRGPVPLDAVEAIWPEGDVVDPLSVLVDHSLVRRTTGVRREPRFGMLSLVRDHAATLLGQDPVDRDGASADHAHYVADGLVDLCERRWTDAAGRWLDDMGEGLQEVRAARAWAVDRDDLALVARITAPLGAYWFLEGHHAEGQRWVEEVLAREAELDTDASARVHLAAGFLAFPQSQSDAREHWQRAVELFREEGETRLLAYALAATSVTYVGMPEHHALAMSINDEALSLARPSGGRALVAQILNIRGEITRVAGEDDLARAAYEEGLGISSDLEDEMYVSVFLANLSYLADHRGDYVEARRLTHEALRICWSVGRRLMAAWTISQLAGPELGLGNVRQAALLIGAGDEALRVLGARRHPGDVPEHERVVAGVRARLGDADFERLRAEGAELSLDQVLAQVLDGTTDRSDGGPVDRTVHNHGEAGDEPGSIWGRRAGTRSM